MGALLVAFWAVIRGGFLRILGIGGTIAATNAAGTAVKMGGMAALWAIQKVFFISLMTVVLTFTLYTLYAFILEQGISLMMDYLSEQNFGDMTLNVTGMGGYVFDKLKLAQCVAVMMAALNVRVVLMMIGLIKR